MFSSVSELIVGSLASSPNVLAIQVQHIQHASSEQDWRWWMGALAPWVGPLLSACGSVYVAWRVFRWQGMRDREEWARDHKKAEWRELLNEFLNIRRDFFRPYSDEKTAYDLVANEKELKHRLSCVTSSYIFIAEVLNEKGLRSRLDMFAVEVSEAVDRISKVSVQKSQLRESRLEGSYISVVDVYDRIVSRTRKIAEEDLGIGIKDTEPKNFSTPAYLDTFKTTGTSI